MKNILFYLLVIFLSSCEREEIYKYKAEKHSSNFIFYASTIYYGEIIEIKYNDDLIFRHKMDSVTGFSNAFQLYREFNLPYTEQFSISISTKFGDNIYIDTTMTGTKGDFGYHLTLSRSLPLDWGGSYFEEGKIEAIKKWGYLPIDSSFRHVTFVADTIYKDTWTDVVN